MAEAQALGPPGACSARCVRSSAGPSRRSSVSFSDPTAGVRRPALRKGGWEPWTDEEMAAFERAYPVGTRERVAYDIARYTGLRRSDVIRIGRPHVSGAASIRITTKKERRAGDRWRCTRRSPSISRQAPIGDLTFVVGPDGAPMRDNAFSKFFQRACRRIGIRKSLHRDQEVDRGGCG